MKKYYVEIFSFALAALTGVFCLYMGMRVYQRAYRELKAKVDNATHAD